MSSTHVLSCPVCHAALLIESRDSIGGVVQPNLVLLDSANETPAAAAARATWEASLTAKEAAQTKLDTAVTALESARQATPPDDAKVLAAEADVATAKTEFDAAVLAEADAQVAYEKAVALPPLPAVGTLSPDGRWSWDGDDWQEVPLAPPPLPAGAVTDSPAVVSAKAGVVSAQKALDDANAALTAAKAASPSDPATVTAAQAKVDAATTAKATADKALSDAESAETADEKIEEAAEPTETTPPATTTAVAING